MIFNHPFSYFPNYLRYPNYPYPYSNYYTNHQRPNNYTKANPTPSLSSIEERKKTDKEPSSEDRGFFEVFGIKLYFDDILLICLIFFLYTEGVEDEMLFLALILLLLS